ncbi:AAA family ATPase [Streptomyces sp. NPDC047097]|uniref:helix-turn-helix transcriptional regulator n=1 Tax=Streptomyces sp. NPDC047097 TaxID=3155260 RepID=UPI003408131B
MHADDVVERTAEIAALRTAVDELMAGSGGSITLRGPAGIGKSTLVREAAALGRAAGARVLSARGTEMEHSFPLGVVRQLFETLVAAASAHERRVWLSGAAAPAADLVGAPGGEQREEAAPGDFGTSHVLYWLTANLCLHRPLMLVIDDAHWADDGSLRFLTFLTQRARDLPLLFVVAVRPGEPGTDPTVSERLAAHPASSVLAPRPLSREGTRVMLRRRLGREAEPAFVDACHAATGGNPLLLEVLTEPGGIEPVAGNAGLVLRTGALAVAHRVSLRLARMPSTAARLVQAVAVWGERASLSGAALLAGLGPGEAAEAAKSLQRVDLLRAVDVPPGAEPEWEFVHPLVRSAVYDSMDWARRIAWHRRAAGLLAERGASASQVGTHLLKVPPGADAAVVTALRRAAAEARGRGSSDSAYAFLRRALAEPPAEDIRAEVLAESGAAALQVDLASCAVHLTDLLALTTDVRERARITCVLGHALLLLSRTAEAVALMSEARDALPESDGDLRRQLEALLLNVPLVVSGWDHLTGRLPLLRALPEAGTPGDRAMAGIIAAVDAFAGDPGAVDHARAALSDGTLNQSTGQATAIGAWFGLLASDRADEAMAALDTEVVRTRGSGSLPQLAVAVLYRALAWLWRGQLAEAEQDVVEALRLIGDTHHVVARPVADAVLVQTLTEQGRFTEAEEHLRGTEVDGTVPLFGMQHWLLEAKAEVLRARGAHEQALAFALAAGERFATHGGRNPALVPWRSEAALNLWALGRKDAAMARAEEELRLARVWGAPRALGRALCVAGMVGGAQSGLEMLGEAVDVLRAGPARLELAKALVQYGAALRRLGRRNEARELLMEGRMLARHCGAGGLVGLAAVELTAAGGSPRRDRVVGPEALTPSEQRVAELASAGRNNRDIAQALFVTTKTVEAHLTNAYRKLQVSSRRELAAALVGGGTSPGPGPRPHPRPRDRGGRAGPAKEPPPGPRRASSAGPAGRGS